MAMERGRDQVRAGERADVAEPRTALRQTSPTGEAVGRLGLRPIRSPALLKPVLLDLQRLVGNRRIAKVVGTARTGRNQPQTSLGAPQLQRAPAPEVRQEAVIRVSWIDDETEFFHRVVNAVAKVKALAPGGKSALYQPLHDPVVGLQRALAPQLGSAFRGAIQLKVSGVLRGGRIGDVAVEQVGSAAGQKQPSTAEEVAGSETGLTAQLLRVLGQASVHGRGSLEIDLINRQGSLEMTGWYTGGSSAGGIDWQRTRDSVKVLLDLAGFAKETTLLYAARFEVNNGAWQWVRVHRLAEVRKLPPATASQPPPDYVDEAQEIVNDIKSKEQFVLSTAAKLIAEQDPTRLRNMVMMVAPFALVKLGRIGKIVAIDARLSREENLARLAVPKVSQLARGRYAVRASLDPKLVEMARELRASQSGVRLEDFGRTNIAVARVNVNGEIHYLDAANVSGQLAHHSEMMIATQVEHLRAQGNTVVIEQLYSERIPCVDCTRMLDDTFKGTQVFYTVPEKFTDAMEGAARGRKLMEAYGMKAE